MDRTSLSCVRVREGAVPQLFPERPNRRRASKRSHVSNALNLDLENPEKFATQTTLMNQKYPEGRNVA